MTFNIVKTLLIVTCALNLSSGYFSRENANDEGWHGRWFPFGPNERDENPVIEDKIMHTIPMGVSNHSCDDAKTNLTVDWDGSPAAYTCFESRSFYTPQIDTSSLLTCEHIPKNYIAIHICMSESIKYNANIPTYGPHRPLWASYGEYQYLPAQRWVHNLEHGAVVMLYHPCSNVIQRNKLKQLVKHCLYRHIITPSALLSPERPLALVTWGCRLEMSVVHVPTVKSFIEEHALSGPEDLYKDGSFNDGLLKAAQVVSTKEDSALCPTVM